MWYNINWYILIIESLPTDLRKPRNIAYLKSLVSPIIWIYNRWVNNRYNNIYKMTHTGQVFSLEKMLNDQLDPSQRRIYIEDGDAFPRVYIFKNSENTPRYLGTLHIHSANNYIDTGVDFKVFVPGEIITLYFNELKAYLDFYKEGVKKYSINEIL